MTDLTKLDYKEIRNQLKEFLKEQDEFTDYDFDGSGISTLLDLLAYNTHYNALLAHINMNETFLDTAQVRSNVVSHAQNIGYVPKSATASRVSLDLEITGEAGSPTVLTIPKGFKFTGKVNNTEYTFVTNTTYTSLRNGQGNYNFTGVEVKQGTIKLNTYRVDGLSPFAAYEIPSENVDINTLAVRVYENPNSQSFEVYQYFDDITEAGSDSTAYFFKENSFGKYEIYFGDNFIGRRPASGSKVEVEYIETQGAEANNIRELSPSSSIPLTSSIAVTLSEGFDRTVNGAPKESLASVKFNAPVSYATQNRAVTANDYRVLLLQEFPDLQDVAAWGGEDNEPPIFGKVFISPALKDRKRATSSFNEAMLLFLKGKNIGAITPEVVEAEYTRLCIDVNYKFNPEKSSKTQGELDSIIRGVIDTYDAEQLNKFTGIFRHSNLVALIDSADPAIVSTNINTTMMKEFTPNPLLRQNYNVKFPSRLYLSPNGEEIMTSNTFLVDGIEAKFGDKPIEGEGSIRQIYVYAVNTGFEIPKYSNVGTIDPESGLVSIVDFKFDVSNLIEIQVKPDSYDLAPSFNQLLRVCRNNLTVDGEVDTADLLGSTGINKYRTAPRN